MDFIEPVQPPLSRSSSYYSLPEYVIEDDMDFTAQNNAENADNSKHLISKTKDFIHSKKCGERHIRYGAYVNQNLPETSGIQNRHQINSLKTSPNSYQV